MSMRSKGLFLAAISMAAMGGSFINNQNTDVSNNPGNISGSSDEPVVSEGFERYYFNRGGECGRGRHTVYFDAVNRNSAMEKFENWLKSL